MRYLAGACIGLFACLLTGVSARAPAAEGAALRIGMPRTFFHDMAEPMIETATEPFVKVLRDATGLAGDVIAGGDVATVARQLKDKKLHLGVFNGFEFAQVRQQHPDLRPLMVLTDTRGGHRAFVLVRDDSPAAKFADLKGKTLAVAKRTKEHVRAYVEQQCEECGAADSKAFFKSIGRPGNVETALDELLQGKSDAAVVDAHGQAFYKDLKPGAFAQLRAVAASEKFPPTVIVYQPGVLPDATLNRVRQGLRAVPNNPAGKAMMMLWKVRGFEPVPNDFDRTLAASLRAYPAPGNAK